jgi:glucose-6-phosphate isomerase
MSTAVFTQDAIWAIDSVDQFGVELGKARAGRVFPEPYRCVEPPLARAIALKRQLAAAMLRQ